MRAGIELVLIATLRIDLDDFKRIAEAVLQVPETFCRDPGVVGETKTQGARSTSFAPLAGEIADAWAGSGPSMRAMAAEMVNSPETSASGETLHIEMIELVTAIVADGVERKELNVRNLAPDFIATIVMAALAGSVSKWFQRPKADLHQILRDTIDLILMGLQSSA